MTGLSVHVLPLFPQSSIVTCQQKDYGTQGKISHAFPKTITVKIMKVVLMEPNVTEFCFQS